MFLFIFKKRFFIKTFLVFFIFSLLGILISIIFLISPPNNDNEKTISIPKGYSIEQITTELYNQKIIRSQFLAKILTKVNGLYLKSGIYRFNRPENLFSVIDRIANAQYGNIYISITFPEGLTNRYLVDKLKESTFSIDKDNLNNIIKEKEGYLFPDTYLFLPDANEEIIIKKMEETFLKKIKLVEKDKTINKSRYDIVIMASIIEKESRNNLHEKQIISGILWKRIAIGMPLQVDAPFLYERGKGSSQLTNNDLMKDSIYNTYTNKGLPPTPIGNPGYDSLYAAAHPLKSNYLFYLHGIDGNIYYGKNYKDHLKNKRMYLR